MTIPNFVAGAWTSSRSADALPITDPASGEALGSVPLSTGDEVGAAVLAAVRAFPAW